jgi:hypothetical protein
MLGAGTSTAKLEVENTDNVKISVDENGDGVFTTPSIIVAWNDLTL